MTFSLGLSRDLAHRMMAILHPSMILFFIFSQKNAKLFNPNHAHTQILDNKKKEM